MRSNYLFQLSNWIQFTRVLLSNSRFLITFFLVLWFSFLLFLLVSLLLFEAASIFLPAGVPFHSDQIVGKIFALGNNAAKFNHLRDPLPLFSQFVCCSIIKFDLNAITGLLHKLVMEAGYDILNSTGKESACMQLHNVLETTLLHLRIRFDKSLSFLQWDLLTQLLLSLFLFFLLILLSLGHETYLLDVIKWNFFNLP